MSTTFANTIDSNPIYATRAEQDKDGNRIDTTYTKSSSLATVATSGSYDDLSNKPTIPAAQVNSDWNASSGVAEILNKPTIPSGEALVPAHSSSDSGKVLGVNSSGNTEWVNAGGGGTQVQSNWAETDTSAVSYIQNKPNLATVATSGSYNDLSDKPTIPSGEELVPAHSSSDSGKVLGVNSSGNTEWVNAGGGGGSYTAGNGIDITNDEISVKYDGQTLVQDLVQGTPTDVSFVTDTYDPKIEVPSDILTLIKSNDKSEFVINIPANNFRVFVSSGTYDLTVNLYYDIYSSRYDTTYGGKLTVSVGSNFYLDEQTIIIKCGGSLWGNYSYDTGFLQFLISENRFQTGSTTLTAPVQFIPMMPGKGPLKVSNPLPSNGTKGQYLKRNETGPVWANLPAQVNADWNSSSGVSKILNKPNLAKVATSGSYNDLSNKPTIPTVDQIYNASSTNAQSGVAVASAISGKQDTIYAGNMISISSNSVGVSTTAGITDIVKVQALPANPVATVLYLIEE